MIGAAPELLAARGADEERRDRDERDQQPAEGDDGGRQLRVGLLAARQGGHAASVATIAGRQVTGW